MNAPLDPIKLADRRPKRKVTRVWLNDAIADDRGRPVANLANAMLALRRSPEVSGAFRYDLMLCAPILVATLPNCGDADTEVVERPRPLRDTDVSQLQEWMQHSGLPKIGKDTIHQAVDLRAQELAFHPVRQLRSVNLDGVGVNQDERDLFVLG